MAFDPAAEKPKKSPAKKSAAKPAEQVEKSKALASQFEQVAKMHQCEFIDLGAVASAAPGEGVHLNAQAHTAIAEAFEKKLREIFG